MRAYRLILLAISLLTISFTGYADNTAKEMNEIKRASDKYFYAESTMPTEKEARSNADNLLISTINSCFEEAGSEQGFTPDMAKSFKYMKMKRGSDIRVLAYILKSETGVDKISAPAPRKDDEPVPPAEPSPAPVKPGTQTSPAAQGKFIPTAAQEETISDLLAADDMQSAMKLLAMFQAMHKVKRYGTVKDAPKGYNPFWLIGTQEFKIGTIITGEESPIDILTGSPARAEDHKGVPMLWFTF